MFEFNEISTRRILTPWGKEVKKRLLDKNMQQNDLVDQVKAAGFDVNKGHISNLMYGIGVNARPEVITEINRILDIE